MHPLFEQASHLTESIIGAAVEVHRDKGPGLIESIYEWCLSKELELRGLSCSAQRIVIVKFSYMKLLDIPLGLLINFHELKLVDGVHRLMLPGANC